MAKSVLMRMPMLFHKRRAGVSGLRDPEILLAPALNPKREQDDEQEQEQEIPTPFPAIGTAIEPWNSYQTKHTVKQVEFVRCIGRVLRLPAMGNRSGRPAHHAFRVLPI